MITKQRIGHELYVYHNGQLLYKRWYKNPYNRGTSYEKAQPSLLYNINGWPNVWLPRQVKDGLVG